MKTLFYGFLFSVLFSFCALSSDFIDGFEDVPLMPGLTQIENQNFSFANEETGYTEAVIRSNNNNIQMSEIKDFYLTVLPKFGWAVHKNESDKLSFMREQDVLEISRVKNKPLTVLINLKSKN